VGAKFQMAGNEAAADYSAVSARDSNISSATQDVFVRLDVMMLGELQAYGSYGWQMCSKCVN
jgi:hypothetical protein